MSYRDWGPAAIRTVGPACAAEHDPQSFTIWTLTARFPLGLKWFDSRAVRRKRHLLPAARRAGVHAPANAAYGASGNAGRDPDHRGGLWGSSAAKARLRAYSYALQWIPRGHHGYCRRPRSRSPACAHAGWRRGHPGPRRLLGRPLYRGHPGARPDEIVALALTLGILCFAVVTAILLLRTRRRRARPEAAARDESRSRLKADVDRAYALLLSEPQILVAWAAAPTSRRSSAIPS